jgi:hypothetical protein
MKILPQVAHKSLTKMGRLHDAPKPPLRAGKIARHENRDCAKPAGNALPSPANLPSPTNGMRRSMGAIIFCNRTAIFLNDRNISTIPE